MIFQNGECTGVITVTYPAKTRTTPSGSKVASFSGRVYGLGEQKYVNIECWDALVPYAEAIEAGDKVHVDGEVREDKYASEKKGEKVLKIVANYLHAQEYVSPGEPDYDDYVEPEPPQYQEPPRRAPSRAAERGQPRENIHDAFEEISDSDAELPF